LKRQSNGEIFRKVAEKSYIPMNNLLEKLLARHPEFKFSFSITGTFIDQAQQFAPDVLESFKRLVRTGRAEIVAETYYHSLAFFFDREEFEAQVRAHQAKIREVFGVETTSFRNTELSYKDDFGFKAILTEGWDPVLGWRSPNFVYRPKNTKNIRLLLKNYKLSDDLAFRFSNQNWEEYPLTTEKYISWLESASYRGDIINLFMDYETFGEHQWEESGIFGFFDLTFISIIRTVSPRIADWVAKNSASNFIGEVKSARNLLERLFPVDTINIPVELLIGARN